MRDLYKQRCMWTRATSRWLASYLDEVFLTAQALPARYEALLVASSFSYAQKEQKEQNYSKLFDFF